MLTDKTTKRMKFSKENYKSVAFFMFLDGIIKLLEALCNSTSYFQNTKIFLTEIDKKHCKIYLILSTYMPAKPHLKVLYMPFPYFWFTFLCFDAFEQRSNIF